MDLTIPGYELAGAVVRRAYTSNGERVLKGHVLTQNALAALSYAIRRLWLRDGSLTPFYVPTDKVPRPLGGRHVIHRGGGRYDVVQGVVLNTMLTKDEADALAARTD